jgi:hypothetical protein
LSSLVLPLVEDRVAQEPTLQNYQLETYFIHYLVNFRVGLYRFFGELSAKIPRVKFIIPNQVRQTAHPAQTQTNVNTHIELLNHILHLELDDSERVLISVYQPR